MGNHISHVGHGSPATGKVILPDGSIQEFQESITVAELMLEYPQQLVIELNEAMMTSKTERPAPLPADKKLEVNRFYVMIPLRRGKPTHLSPQEAHLTLLRASTLLRSKTIESSSRFLPLFARILPVSSGVEDSYHKIVVSKKELSVLEKRETEEHLDDDGVEGLEFIERKYYLKRQVCGKGWKPSLDTIEEKNYESNEVSHWASLAVKVAKRIEDKGLVWG